MSGADLPTLPPVRLPTEAELARDALSVPLVSRAAALARWAEPGVPVGAGAELLAASLAEAVTALGLEAEEYGAELAVEAWNFAVDTGLVEITEEDEDAGTATAAPGADLDRLTGGAPEDVLDLWADGLEAVLADAATPTLEDLLGEDLESLDPAGLDLEALDWDADEEAAFLDSALAQLYLLAATDEKVAAGAMVPLPVVAAALVVPDEEDTEPEGTGEPSDETLEEVSAVMMRLDEQFRVLEGTGLLEYDPVDPALIVEESEGEAGPAPELPAEEEDLTRYGQVRLTPLGVYGVRRRMREAGLDAPAVGDLATADAAPLLLALPRRAHGAAQAEAEGWLAGRDPLTAARELLTAARGTDPQAPLRRLGCQLALSLLGPAAEPALREVLDDPELGGLARVWLADRDAAGVPAPGQEMVYWLTVDTLAAQLATVDEEDPGEADELRTLVDGLTVQHGTFFEHAWRVDHPATAEVLEAIGRLHPDPALAEEARAAALRARSRAE
ncbi:hypothetical protein ACGFX7_00395 [Streptomyces harbinensis]|uniref:hypothetical protein n=1 Tax=Streptomyces harbinensis TaxID=1176198 RepID=UPI00371A5AA2